MQFPVCVSGAINRVDQTVDNFANDATSFAVKMRWINPEHTEQFKTTLIWLTTAACFQGTLCDSLVPPAARPYLTVLCSPLVLAIIRQRVNFLPAWFANTTALVNGGLMGYSYFKNASSSEEEGGKVSQFFVEILWYQTMVLFVDLLAKRLFSARSHSSSIDARGSREVVSVGVVMEIRSDELERIQRTRDDLQKACLSVWAMIEGNQELLALFRQCQNATKHLLLPPPPSIDRTPLVQNPVIEAERIAYQECLYWEACQTRIIDFFEKNPGFRIAFLNKLQPHVDAPVRALLGKVGS